MAEIHCLKGEIAIVDDDILPLIIDFPWRVATNGYVVYKHGKSGPTVYLHRLIMNARTGEEIDHRQSQTKLDNRRSNLRRCPHRLNLANQRKWKKATTSKFKGVSWNKKAQKWMAYIKANQKRHYLGCFENESDAALAYNAAAIEKFGEYASLNQVIGPGTSFA